MGWIGPYTSEEEAIAACDSCAGWYCCETTGTVTYAANCAEVEALTLACDVSSSSGSGNCLDGIPETLYLTYSCENCECRTVEVSAITGPTATGPHVYQWGFTPNNCGADAGDHVLFTCVLGDDGVTYIPGDWTFVHAQGYDTVVALSTGYEPLVVDFGQYNQQNCDGGLGGPCSVTLSE